MINVIPQDFNLNNFKTYLQENPNKQINHKDVYLNLLKTEIDKNIKIYNENPENIEKINPNSFDINNILNYHIVVEIDFDKENIKKFGYLTYHDKIFIERHTNFDKTTSFFKTLIASQGYDLNVMQTTELNFINTLRKAHFANTSKSGIYTSLNKMTLNSYLDFLDNAINDFVIKKESILLLFDKFYPQETLTNIHLEEDFVVQAKDCEIYPILMYPTSPRILTNNYNFSSIFNNLPLLC